MDATKKSDFGVHVEKAKGAATCVDYPLLTTRATSSAQSMSNKVVRWYRVSEILLGGKVLCIVHAKYQFCGGVNHKRLKEFCTECALGAF